MSYQIAIRRDTTANWAAANPILVDGELAYDYTATVLKIGDGDTHWNDLPALSLNGSDGTVVGGVGVEMQNSGGWIQYRSGGDWINLVTIAQLTGPQGPAGLTGSTGATGPTGPAAVVDYTAIFNGVGEVTEFYDGSGTWRTRTALLTAKGITAGSYTGRVRWYAAGYTNPPVPPTGIAKDVLVDTLAA